MYATMGMGSMQLSPCSVPLVLAGGEARRTLLASIDLPQPQSRLFFLTISILPSSFTPIAQCFSLRNQRGAIGVQFDVELTKNRCLAWESSANSGACTSGLMISKYRTSKSILYNKTPGRRSLRNSTPRAWYPALTTTDSSFAGAGTVSGVMDG